MARRYLFGSRHREDLWQRERHTAHAAGRGDLPICNLCDRPVLKTDAWDESHAPEKPRSFGGKSVGIAHRHCNREHGAKVVVPAIAKTDRMRQRAIGARGAGLGRRRMAGGVRSRISRTFRNGVVPRLTHAQKHAAAMAKRYFAVEAEPEPAP